MLVTCVMDGKPFETSHTEAEIATIRAAAKAKGSVPMLVCSRLCADEYDINCFDWPQAKREARGIRPY